MHLCVHVGILRTDFLLRDCSEPIPAEQLPLLLVLLSKLEIAVQVDTKLLLAPSLLPESIDYPPPVYVGLSKKAFLVDKDIYNTKESPGDWLKSVSEDSAKKVMVNNDSKKTSVESVFTNAEIPADGEDEPSYLKITDLNLDDIIANADTSSDDDDDCSTSTTPHYPRFSTIKSFGSSTSSSSLYRQFSEPFYQSIKNVEVNIAYHPPLFRIWLAHFIPEGFWPRLLCRIASDFEIDATFTKLFPSTLKRRKVDESHSLNRTDIEGCFLWNLWKTGLVFVHEGVTLLELKQGINEPVNCAVVPNPRLFSEKYRIEVVVHISSLAVVHNHDSQQAPLPNKEIVELGTKLLVLIEQHVVNIGEEWYYNTLSKTEDKNVSSYVLCTECLACKPQTCTPNYTACYFISVNGEVATCFAFKDVLKSFIEVKPLQCPCHQEIPIQLLAPDLVSHHMIINTCLHFI